ncbi:MAG: hypothetical protein WC588_05635 [Candidatus Micrarchaeia archaeon]
MPGSQSGQGRGSKPPFPGRLLDCEDKGGLRHQDELAARKEALETIVEGVNLARLFGNRPRAIILLGHAMDEANEWPDTESWKDEKIKAIRQIALMMNEVLFGQVLAYSAD